MAWFFIHHAIAEFIGVHFAAQLVGDVPKLAFKLFLALFSHRGLAVQLCCKSNQARGGGLDCEKEASKKCSVA